MILRTARCVQHEEGRVEMHATINPRMDNCLRMADDVVRRKAIAWRCNNYGVRRRCVCGHQFRRTHIEGCIDTHFPPSLDDHLMVRDSDIQKYPKLHGTSYNIIDSLLNHGQYELFSEVMDLVDQCLGQPELPLDMVDHEEPVLVRPRSPSPDTSTLTRTRRVGVYKRLLCLKADIAFPNVNNLLALCFYMYIYRILVPLCISCLSSLGIFYLSSPYDYLYCALGTGMS